MPASAVEVRRCPWSSGTSSGYCSFTCCCERSSKERAWAHVSACEFRAAEITSQAALAAACCSHSTWQANKYRGSIASGLSWLGTVQPSSRTSDLARHASLLDISSASAESLTGSGSNRTRLLG